MNTADRFQIHENLCMGLNQLYRAKNEDYGDSFGESFRKYGPIAALTRMSDKFLRIENLILGHEPNVSDETVMDTLYDLANYALMTMVEIKRGKEKEGEA